MRKLKHILAISLVIGFITPVLIGCHDHHREPPPPKGPKPPPAKPVPPPPAPDAPPPKPGP